MRIKSTRPPPPYANDCFKTESGRRVLFECRRRRNTNKKTTKKKNAAIIVDRLRLKLDRSAVVRVMAVIYYGLYWLQKKKKNSALPQQRGLIFYFYSLPEQSTFNIVTQVFQYYAC